MNDISPERDRIENAYRSIKKIYRAKGLSSAFYTFYRNATCPIRDIFSHIPKGKRYVDIGCGFGFISIWTAMVFPEAQVQGFDLIPSRIQFASRLADSAGISNLSFQTADITREEVVPADIVLLIDLFHHIPFESQFPFLKQCIDKSPPGATIIFKDIDRHPFWKFWVNYVQDLLFTRAKTYSRSKDEYMEFFRNSGLEATYIDLKKGYPYAHYLIRAKKKS